MLPLYWTIGGDICLVNQVVNFAKITEKDIYGDVILGHKN